jgi:tRNA isopentenyl-2-thiomethyl-A-37 hydroxylase MiaE
MVVRIICIQHMFSRELYSSILYIPYKYSVGHRDFIEEIHILCREALDRRAEVRQLVKFSNIRLPLNT